MYTNLNSKFVTLLNYNFFFFLQSFVVPVNIRVTDVNDNAPQWIGAPYSLSLSEVTVPGTR